MVLSKRIRKVAVFAAMCSTSVCASGNSSLICAGSGGLAYEEEEQAAPAAQVDASVATVSGPCPDSVPKPALLLKSAEGAAHTAFLAENTASPQPSAPAIEPAATHLHERYVAALPSSVATQDVHSSTGSLVSGQIVFDTRMGRLYQPGAEYYVFQVGVAFKGETVWSKRATPLLSLPSAYAPNLENLRSFIKDALEKHFGVYVASDVECDIKYNREMVNQVTIDSICEQLKESATSGGNRMWTFPVKQYLSFEIRAGRSSTNVLPVVKVGHRWVDESPEEDKHAEFTITIGNLPSVEARFSNILTFGDKIQKHILPYFKCRPNKHIDIQDTFFWQCVWKENNQEFLNSREADLQRWFCDVLQACEAKNQTHAFTELFEEFCNEQNHQKSLLTAKKNARETHENNMREQREAAEFAQNHLLNIITR